MVASRRIASTSASHIRAPASRGSRPSWAQSVTPQLSPDCAERPVSGTPPHAPGSVVGRGAANGISTVFNQAASSTVPRPVSRTPPMPSSFRVRNRPWCAARSSRSKARSSRRSTPSGSSRSTTRRPSRARSVASWSRACSSRSCSAAARRPGFTGNRSTAATTTSACDRDTAPAARSSPVAHRSPARAWASATSRRPDPFGPPVAAVTKSFARGPAVHLRRVRGVDRRDRRQLHRVQHRPQPLRRPDRREQHLRRRRDPARPGQPRQHVGHRLQRPHRRACVTQPRRPAQREARQALQLGEVHGVGHERHDSSHHRQNLVPV